MHNSSRWGDEARLLSLLILAGNITEYPDVNNNNYKRGIKYDCINRLIGGQSKKKKMEREQHIHL